MKNAKATAKEERKGREGRAAKVTERAIRLWDAPGV